MLIGIDPYCLHGVSPLGYRRTRVLWILGCISSQCLNLDILKVCGDYVGFVLSEEIDPSCHLWAKSVGGRPA